MGSVCSRLLDEELTAVPPTVVASELEFFDTIGTMLDDATLNEELTEAELEAPTAPIKLPVAATAPAVIVHPVPLVKSKI